MAYDAVDRNAVLFGGFNSARYLGDTWTFDGTTWTHRMTSKGPRSRAGTASAYDAVTQQVVMFGGAAPRSAFLGDT